MAKVICSEAIWRVVDRSMQILGGLGITDETIVARLFREVRPFRIYDGPSEAHRWSIAGACAAGGRGRIMTTIDATKRDETDGRTLRRLPAPRQLSAPLDRLQHLPQVPT